MPLQTKLISVTIEYCKGKMRFQKVITGAELDEIGGLWWQNPGASNNGNNYVPVPPTPMPNDPCPTDLVGGGGSACWYDPQSGQWICPDGLG